MEGMIFFQYGKLIVGGAREAVRKMKAEAEGREMPLATGISFADASWKKVISAVGALGLN